MNKLLRFLMSRVFAFGVVEDEGGGAVVLEDEPAGDDPAPVPDGDTPADPASGAVDDDEEGVIVSLGDEPAPAEEQDARAPEWVRELRHKNREQSRLIRELETKLAAAAPAQPEAIVVGDKPTLEACDYDPDRFGAELEAWHERKLKAEHQQREREEADKAQRATWQARLDQVATAAASLKLRDMDEAQQSFEDTFSVLQQGIIVGGPDDAKSSALLRYALGKNPAKAQELAKIKDPVKFAFAIAKLESQLKVTPRKVAPAPDARVRSGVPGAAALDGELARLQAEADKTGDRSKVAAYLREKQRRAA